MPSASPKRSAEVKGGSGLPRFSQREGFSSSRCCCGPLFPHLMALRISARSLRSADTGGKLSKNPCLCYLSPAQHPVSGRIASTLRSGGKRTNDSSCRGEGLPLPLTLLSGFGADPYFFPAAEGRGRTQPRPRPRPGGALPPPAEPQPGRTAAGWEEAPLGSRTGSAGASPPARSRAGTRGSRSGGRGPPRSRRAPAAARPRPRPRPPRPAGTRGPLAPCAFPPRRAICLRDRSLPDLPVLVLTSKEGWGTEKNRHHLATLNKAPVA